MGYAYMAKAAAVTPVTTPEEPIVWPPVWEWPPPGWPPTDWPPTDWPTTTVIEDTVWPPAWPPPIAVTYTISLSCATTIDVGSAIAFTVTTLDSGIDTADLNNHIVAIHATLDGEAVNVKKLSGDEYSNMVWYYVGNYSGSSYGLSESIYVDIDAADANKTLTLCATVITVTPLLTATDTATVQDNSLYASIAGTMGISASLNTSSSASLTPATGSITATISDSKINLYGGISGTVVGLRQTSSGTAVDPETTGNVGTSGIGTGSWKIYRRLHKITIPTYAAQPTTGVLVFNGSGYVDNETFDLDVYASNSDVETIGAEDWDAGSVLLGSVVGVTSTTVLDLDLSNVDSGANCIVLRKSSEASNGMITPGAGGSTFYLWIGA